MTRGKARKREATHMDLAWSRPKATLYRSMCIPRRRTEIAKPLILCVFCPPDAMLIALLTALLLSPTVSPPHATAPEARSLHDVDFLNFVYPNLFDGKEARLRNGRAEVEGGGASIGGIYIGAFGDSAEPVAVISIGYFGPFYTGMSGFSSTNYYAYRLGPDGRPLLVGASYGGDISGTGIDGLRASMYSEGDRLWYRGVVSAPDEPTCCPTRVGRLSIKVRNGGFRPTGRLQTWPLGDAPDWPEPYADWVVGLDHVGPIQYGEPLSSVYGTASDTGCHEIRPTTAPYGLTLLVVDGRVEGARMVGPNWTTRSGIRPGYEAAYVRETYGGRVSPGYVGRRRGLLYTAASGGPRRVGFDLDDGRVVALVGGDASLVGVGGECLISIPPPVPPPTDDFSRARPFPTGLVSTRVEVDGELVVEGEIENSDVRMRDGQWADAYSVRLSPGQELSVRLLARGFNPSLIVVSPGGQRVENKDCTRGDFIRSCLTITAEVSGDYRVVAVGPMSGSYRLFFEVSGAPVGHSPPDGAHAVGDDTGAAELPRRRDLSLLPLRGDDAYDYHSEVEYDDSIACRRTRSVRVRHIQLPADDLDRLRALRLDILRGATTFEAAARQHSADASSASNGGDLGWVPRGRMVPQFEAQAFAAPIGVPFGPFLTPFGAHLVSVEDRAPEACATPDRPWFDISGDYEASSTDVRSGEDTYLYLFQRGRMTLGLVRAADGLHLLVATPATLRDEGYDSPTVLEPLDGSFTVTLDADYDEEMAGDCAYGRATLSVNGATMLRGRRLDVASCPAGL